jgi:dTDP-4-dehydrorhamnose 3,5-epimerase-like enzyme
MKVGIPDVILGELQGEVTGSREHVRLLSFDDHMLRRFGQLDWLRRAPGELLELTLRAVADEIWILTEGEATCLCRDMRSGSPSEGQELKLELSAPARLLIPFGVAFGWQATGSTACMIRCSTHQDDDHPEDRVIPLEASG